MERFDSTRLSSMLEIAEKAIECQRLEAEERFAKGELIEGYINFKENHGLAHVERDTYDWRRMLEVTTPQYEEHEEAKRLLRNAKARLKTAIRRHNERGSS